MPQCRSEKTYGVGKSTTVRVVGGRRRHRGDLRPVSARRGPAPAPRARRGEAGPAGAGSLVAREWLLRITPAAGFSDQQVVPQFSQVAGASYGPNWGYCPLEPWAGSAVERALAAAALALAFCLLRRRDA